MPHNAAGLLSAVSSRNGASSYAPAHQRCLALNSAFALVRGGASIRVLFRGRVSVYVSPLVATHELVLALFPRRVALTLVMVLRGCVLPRHALRVPTPWGLQRRLAQPLSARPSSGAGTC